MLLVLDMRQAIGKRTSHEMGHLEICMSAKSQVMLDQVLEKAHMTRLNGWYFLSIDIDEGNAALFPSIYLFSQWPFSSHLAI